MVSMSSLASPFSNCCARVARCCYTNEECLKTIAKVSAFFLAGIATTFIPMSDTAKGSVLMPLMFLSLREVTKHHYFSFRPTADKKWLRTAVALAWTAGVGACPFAYKDKVGGFLGLDKYFFIVAPIFGLGAALAITNKVVRDDYGRPPSAEEVAQLDMGLPYEPPNLINAE